MSSKIMSIIDNELEELNKDKILYEELINEAVNEDDYFYRLHRDSARSKIEVLLKIKSLLEDENGI